MAKFKVMGEMAPFIFFGTQKIDGNAKTIVSYKPFDREWQVLEQINALQTPNRRHNFIALKSTDAELFIPNAFMVLFSITAIVVLIAIVFHFNDFCKSWLNVLIN